ncbi:MAG: disulfide bond formation protein B [Defluviimonas sp.]|uniref:disulfide bond formation protein B n=1 Tax=Albidovulum sp. TaxID=1872424 RepID=UPI001D2E587D|nr:disulfide bond formation protein B [Paracoccaceae bacterium]MCC0065034.1 disulfide bond formation protein B [Defluviimonas sp.]
MDRRLILIAAGGSAALLLGAFGFQLMGYAPCELCLWQRWPHGAAVLAGALAILTRARLMAWIGALSAAATGALGIYHTGVERAWWTGPTACSSSGDLAGSADDLLNQIMSAPLVRCNEVAWSFAGLSMASWNAVLSFALALLWVLAARSLARP